MSDPNEEDSPKDIDESDFESPDGQDNTRTENYFEFSVSEKVAADDSAQVPVVVQPDGNSQAPKEAGVRVNKDARKVSNHPLGNKLCMKDPMLNRPSIRARNAAFALTRRKKTGNRFMINTQLLWTLEERVQLMKALKKYGLFDVCNLQKSVPTKTESQVMDFIDAAQAITDSTINGNPSDKKPSEDLLSPVGQWLYAMEAETCDQKDRFAAFNLALPKVFLYIAKFGNHPPPSECGGINYSDAYEYIYHMLSGQPGKEMSAETIQLMRKTLLNLSMRARNASSSQVDFIKGISPTPNGLANYEHYGTPSAGWTTNPKKTPLENAVQEVISNPTANPLRVPEKMLHFTNCKK